MGDEQCDAENSDGGVADDQKHEERAGSDGHDNGDMMLVTIDEEHTEGGIDKDNLNSSRGRDEIKQGLVGVQADGVIDPWAFVVESSDADITMSRVL